MKNVALKNRKSITESNFKIDFPTLAMGIVTIGIIFFSVYG
jgi:hypothetical protein